MNAIDALEELRSGFRAKQPLSRSEIRNFQAGMFRVGKLVKRELPWRTRRTPYRVIVSEVMLQQTQAARVVRKFNQFVKEKPNFARLAESSVAELYELWSGLGYNRRALSLRSLSQTVVADCKGRLPKELHELEALPGIGKYTARAVRVFAFNQPEVLIETNIRALYTHIFFKGTRLVRDDELHPLIESTIDRSRPSFWFDTCMDVGSALKAQRKELTARSAHFVKQSPFKGSNREKRGRVLKLLNREGRASLRRIAAELQTDEGIAKPIVLKLEEEGFLVRRNRAYFLA